MPKAILTYKLPEERDDFDYAMSGRKFYFVIDHMLHHLRHKLKYEELTEQESIIYENIRNMLWGFVKKEDLERFF